ncbi:MAG: bifunctional hydroxymethylpyrimidine kinase/phosphomethylpyrimidine kinase [Myxococcales bacterium]|nr:bifunctional hydroxymethylpyrimidine kinase/phosphomethylpyrimidine kinase [Myxococcales bacterium]
MTIPNALTIAGSDSGGGAGIQADLKTMSARGVFGCSVITALTAQNTERVSAIHHVTPSFVEAQLDAVLSDIHISAVKIGMLGSAAITEAIARRLRQHNPPNIVVDPVMVAQSGDRLLQKSALEALRAELIPSAHILTPNLPEAGALLDRPEPKTPEEMLALGQQLHTLGSTWVLIKGGHSSDPHHSTDLLIGPEETIWLEGPRIDTPNTHGTGCTLSSAIAAELAKGSTISEAVHVAKAYVTEAIRHAGDLKVGFGQGPVHHFHGFSFPSAP